MDPPKRPISREGCRPQRRGTGCRVVEWRAVQAPQPIAVRPVSPLHLVAVELPRHGDHLLVEGAELVDTVVERGGDADARSVETGDVVHSVLEGAVGEHVVDQPTRGDHDAVAGLPDPLDVSFDPSFVDLPHPT